MNQRWRPMESRIYNKRRTFQTNHHVLWTDQLSGNIPNDDEHHIPWPHSGWKHDCLYGRHGYSHSTPTRRNHGTIHRMTLEHCKSSTCKAWWSWPLPQPGKVQFQTTPHWLSRCTSHWRNSPNGTRESRQGTRVKTPPQCYRSPKVSRVHRLLPILYTRLLTDCMATPQPHKESHAVALG